MKRNHFAFAGLLLALVAINPVAASAQPSAYSGTTYQVRSNAAPVYRRDRCCYQPYPSFYGLFFFDSDRSPRRFYDQHFDQVPLWAQKAFTPGNRR